MTKLVSAQRKIAEIKARNEQRILTNKLAEGGTVAITLKSDGGLKRELRIDSLIKLLVDSGVSSKVAATLSFYCPGTSEVWIINPPNDLKHKSLKQGFLKEAKVRVLANLKTTEKKGTK